MSEKENSLSRKTLHPYGYVANSIINDKTLSFNAKGVYLYLLSKPDKWDFSAYRIASDSATSQHTVLKALKELEDHNLLERKKQQNGRVIYIITDPVTECVIEKSQNAYSQNGNPQIAPDASISKKENIVRKRDISKQSLQAPINEIMDLFKGVNPTHDELFRNTTERKALEYLVDKFGAEKISRTIRALPGIVSQPYAPKITKPTELKRDFAKLIIFHEQNKNITQSKTRRIA